VNLFASAHRVTLYFPLMLNTPHRKTVRNLTRPGTRIPLLFHTIAGLNFLQTTPGGYGWGNRCEERVGVCGVLPAEFENAN
jgi:hypothetical protein